MEQEEEEEEANDDLFEVLSVDGILQIMEQIIQDVSSIIQLPEASIRLLLNQNNWDKEKLLENWSGDMSDISESAETPESGAGVSKVDNCKICLLKSTTSKRSALECGHSYCNKCWLQYLTGKIMDLGLSQIIACPTSGCNILVEDQMVFDLVTDPEVRLRYQTLIANSFVDCYDFVRWCPSPGCSKAIKVTSDLTKFVRCDCGYEFCFPCGSQLHEPVDCDLLTKWFKKCEDDSETSNWINAKTKPCPKCQTAIEKNGGCHHMTCGKESCQYQFCWLCMDDWNTHRVDCNRFVKVADDQASTSEAALAKYLFYYDRYMNHQRSLNLEKQFQTTLTELKDKMADRGVSRTEIQFLDQALEGLCQSRRTLMYTYVFAFYLERDNHAEIFEENQNDLEKKVEKLSSYLENELTAENVLTLKQSIVDEHKYCLSRRQVILDHVEEGYGTNIWSFN